MFDASEETEVAKVRALEERMAFRAIELGGTCTGEHGVGTGKLKYLESEFGRPACDTMRAIKAAIDPKGLFNPGKCIPAAPARS